jgi:photosystem II stability/assembly factor-like uncharacterized protein
MKYSFVKWFFFLLIILLSQVNIFLAQENFWAPAQGPLGGGVYTVKANSSGDIFVGSGFGVWKTTDKGTTWKLTNSGIAGGTIQEILVMPDGKLFAAANTNTGLVYKSTDNGASWASVSKGLKEGALIVAFVKSSSGDLYIGTSTFGLYKSTDNGDNWSKVSSFSDPFVQAITVSPNGNIYVAASQKVYVSKNNSTTWTPVSNGLTNDLIRAMCANSTNDIYIATATAGILRLPASDTIWVPVNTGLPTTNVYSIIPTPSGQLYTGLYNQGLWKSTDNGATWTKPFAYNYLSISSILYISDSEMYAGDGRKLLKSIGGSDASWYYAYDGLFSISSEIYSFAHNSKAIYVCSLDGSIAKSTNSGDTWTDVTGYSTSTLHGLAVNDSGHVFAGQPQGGVYYTKDEGANWLTNNQVHDPYVFIFTKKGTLLTGTRDSGIYRSTNNGTSWIKRNTDISGHEVTSFAINSKGDIYAAANSFIYYSTNDGDTWNKTTGTTGANVLAFDSKDNLYSGVIWGIEKSTDGGATWKANYDGIGNTAIFSIAITSDDKIFAGGLFSTKVYVSTDGGDTWNTEMSGLVTNGNIYGFGFDPQGYIYAGNATIFRSTKPVTDPIIPTDVKEVINQKADNYKLSQNYPNPFNPSTIINYTIPEAGNVKITVFDILGREVSALVNQFQTKGSYSVKFDGSNLTSGVYFYQIKSGDFVRTQKMILAK